MKIMIFLFCFLFAALLAQAQIIHVHPDSLYNTIQSGINAANPGDTVLVSDEVYYEQINFLGMKPLTVGSHFIIDGDTSHIANTIIDGSQITDPDSASVVYFVTGEDTTSILCGFTIQGGKGTIDYFPSVVGGGIYIRDAGASILNNRITGNHLIDPDFPGCLGLDGGGIFIDNSTDSWCILENNEISDNSITAFNTECGSGGIGVISNARIRNNLIKGNSCIQNLTDTVAYLYAGGLCFDSYTSAGNELLLLDNIFESNSLIGLSGWGAGAVLKRGIVTCTGNEFSGNKIMDQTDFGGGGLGCEQLPSGSRISNNIFRDNESSKYGGGMFIGWTQNWIEVENNYFFNNSARTGGGFTSWYSTLILQNNVFYSNQADVSAGAVYLTGDDIYDFHTAFLVNNSFSHNKASNGGAIFVNLVSTLILNSVFWQDSAATESQEIGVNFPWVELAYCNIDTNLISHITGNPIIGEGMISQDPNFADTLLNLTMLSPGIDIGIDQLTCHNHTWLAPLYDIDNMLRPWPEEFDMGAHEYGSIPIGIKEPSVVSHQSSVISYPNPFSECTTLEYNLEEPGMVTLTIFNNLGLECEVLVNEQQEQGEHQVQWNAEGLPSGIYFYRLMAGSQSSIGKMLVVR